MSNRFVYHYCAHYQIVAKTVYIDGIIKLENRITCHEQYMDLKPNIAPDHCDKLTIDSFSFIGMEFEE